MLSLAPGGAPSELFAYLWRSHFSRAVSWRAIEQHAIAYAKNIARGDEDATLCLLVAARGASPPVAGLDSPVTPPTFDVFYRLQVTNYGVFYVLFDSPPSGSNPIDIWDLYLHAQMAFPDYFVATVLATSPRREQAEKAVLIACVT